MGSCMWERTGRLLRRRCNSFRVPGGRDTVAVPQTNLPPGGTDCVICTQVAARLETPAVASHRQQVAPVEL